MADCKHSLEPLELPKTRKPVRRERLSMGIPELDKMIGGGVLEGDSILVAGLRGQENGSGTQFIAAGLRNGEPGIIAVFEERQRYTERADSFGLKLKRRRKRESWKSFTVVRSISR